MWTTKEGQQHFIELKEPPVEVTDDGVSKPIIKRASTSADARHARVERAREGLGFVHHRGG